MGPISPALSAVNGAILYRTCCGVYTIFTGDTCREAPVVGAMGVCILGSMMTRIVECRYIRVYQFPTDTIVICL